MATHKLTVKSPVSDGDYIRLGIMAVSVNIVFMLIKIGAGIIGNSYALVADGIESASDIFSSLITWAGFYASLKPPDKEHPYGHGKIESLAGMFSGLCLFGAAGFIAVNSVSEIITPHHSPSWFTLPVLVVVMVTKEILSRKILSAGRGLESTALKGDAWHHRSDAITSAAAAVGISIALIGGERFAMADDWAALLACAIIVINGYRIFRVALHDLLDGSVSSEILESITVKASSVNGVCNIEKCGIRKSGIGLFIDMHMHVDPLMTVAEGHRISHEVKDLLMADDSRICDVIIHIEPAVK